MNKRREQRKKSNRLKRAAKPQTSNPNAAVQKSSGWGTLLRTWASSPMVFLLGMIGAGSAQAEPKYECPPADAATMKDARYNMVHDNILARDISQLDLTCARKTHGMNKGGVCCWDGVWHYMKNEVANERLLELHNLRLVHEVMNATVPKAEYVNRMGIISLAAEKMPGFQWGKSFWPQPYDAFVYRNFLASKIGEAGIAQLAVVMTLIGDLNNQENWGLVDGKLVFIDVDGGKQQDGTSMQPKTVAEYLDLSRSVFQFARSKIPLSVNNIIAMADLYEKMLDKPIPKVHPSVDIPKNLFHQVLKSFISVCDGTVAQIRKDRPEADDAAPDYANNDILSWKAGDEKSKLASIVKDGITLNSNSSLPGAVTASITAGHSEVANVVNSVLQGAAAASVILAVDKIGKEAITQAVGSAMGDSDNTVLAIDAASEDKSISLSRHYEMNGPPSMFIPVLASAATMAMLAVILWKRNVKSTPAKLANSGAGLFSASGNELKEVVVEKGDVKKADVKISDGKQKYSR